jgi:hypothetical protein
MSSLKAWFVVGSLGVALAGGCSSGTASEDGTPPASPESSKPEVFFPPPLCASLPQTQCPSDVGYQIELSSYRLCPIISLPGGGTWTPGDPGLGVRATILPEHPLGPSGSFTSGGYYDAPNPFAGTAWVCSYAYENARNADGTAYHSTPGVTRIDAAVICGTLQWTKIAYIVSCPSLGTGTSTGGRGCDTCLL